tara:strand:+ start:212 stop:586 length:375 start_codon:yes stop_codon:yes gene_type:complete
MDKKPIDEKDLFEHKQIKELYTYAGEIMHVYKKNLIAVNVDLGFATWRRVPMKFVFVDVPEENGKAFQDLMNGFFEKNDKVLIRGWGYQNNAYACEMFSKNDFKEIFYNNEVIKAGVGYVSKTA